MKKRILTACIGLATMLMSCFTACGNNTPPVDNPVEEKPPVTELQDGTITFDDAVCESIIDMENSGTVDIATASNGADVTYTVADDDVERLSNAFDGKLTIASDGTIQGSYNAIKRFKVDIIASAEKCEEVTAEITISVVNPHLTYAGSQLADARVGTEYATSVAVIGESVDADYDLEDGELPAGLELSDDGTITGIPEIVGRGEPFTVTASARGYSDTTAEFVIDVVIDHSAAPGTPGKIVRFGGEEPISLKDYYVGGSYVNQGGIATGYTLNNNPITYTLADGSNLPEGLVLYPNGALIGKTDVIGEYKFDVVARAMDCEDVTGTFTLNVMSPQVIYELPTIGPITRGEAADVDISTATTSEGDEGIVYSMTAEDAAVLLNNYGLTVTQDGHITGVPTDVTASMNFRVTASKEGFTPVTVTVYLTINEPLQTAESNIFEAELTNLMGKQGTGYSASPTGTGLIDKTNENAHGGAFLSYLHNSTITIEFVVYAEEALDNVPLYLSLGSELGTVTFEPDNLGIYTYVGRDTSGARTTVSYSGQSVSGGNQTYAGFSEIRCGSVNLAQGWNVIQIAVLDNDLRGDGIPGGPGLDYIRLDTTGTVKWIPLTYNLD